ncbi:hypothetical protein KPL70_023225 [Citrus sinensis]|nr:hypothetical protein KPL70_023225 [Citrus sinensis]
MAKKEEGEGSSSLGGDQRIINNKAHSMIILHLSDEVLREVSKERTASGLWAKLEEMFMKKSLAKRLYIKRRLYTFSMKDEVAMKDHVDEFNKLILDLENVNIILEDEDSALILLSSLPESYEHFVDTLLYGRQTLSLKDVKDAMESKDLKKRAEVKDQSNGEGLVAKRKPEKKYNKQKKNNNQKDKTEKKKKKRKCYFCQKEGHYIKDCFEKKKLEELQKKSNGKAAVASEDECDYDEADVLVAAERHLTSEWIMDSGCSFHMCPNKSFFKTFENVNGGKVLLGNNLACKVAGITTISLKMFDGVTRDLYQARYVPELKRNLISLGMVDQSGCIIKAENGEIQVSDQGKIVMKGVRKNGLYILVGSSPVHGISASVTRDKTKLWHMRLAHISERDLRELSNQGLFGNDKVTSLKFCEKCIFRKATKLKFSLGRKETKQTLDYIHSDLWGPSQVPSLGGARYFVSFIDDFLRKAEAVTTAAYLINRSPSSALGFKTPQELWSGKPPDLSNLRIFGCPAYAHIKQGKLEPRAVKGYFLGYPKGIKGYKIWTLNGKSSRILISRDVTFDEEKMLQSKVETNIEVAETEEAESAEQKVEHSDGCKISEEPTEQSKEGKKLSKLKTYQLARDRERRAIKIPKKYGIADLISFALTVADEVNGKEPLSYKQAMCCGDKLKCLDEEIFMAQPEGFIERGLEDNIIRDRDSKTLYLSQADYVKKVLARFNIEDSKPITTPLSTHFQLSKSLELTTDDDLNYMRKIPYSSAVGSIMYALVCTRPDLAHGVGVTSRFIGNPSKDHWNTVKWILRYLRGTVVTFIMFGKISGASPEVAGFVDFDYAADKDRRRMHFIRDEISKGVVNMVKVASEVNPADMLTKPLPSVSWLFTAVDVGSFVELNHLPLHLAVLFVSQCVLDDFSHLIDSHTLELNIQDRAKQFLLTIAHAETSMKSLKNQGKVEELDRALAKAKLDNEKTAGEWDRFKHDLNVLNEENAH